MQVTLGSSGLGSSMSWLKETLFSVEWKWGGEPGKRLLEHVGRRVDWARGKNQELPEAA